MLKFHYMLKKLQLHKEEYVLMQAISLFSPGESPTCPTWLPVPTPTPSGLLATHQLQPWEATAPSSALPGKVPNDGPALHSPQSQDGDSGCFLLGLGG